jgi:hypothetical protein
MRALCRHHVERPRDPDEVRDADSFWRWQDMFVMFTHHTEEVRREDES